MLWMWLVGSALAGAPEPVTTPLVAIEVRGERRVDEAAVLATMDAAVGEVPSSADLRRDLKALWGTGWFSDVRFTTHPRGGGQVLVVWVQERPAVGEVVLLGAKDRDEDELLETLALEAGLPLSDAEAELAVDRLQRSLESEGYTHAEVALRRVPAGPDLEDVVVEISRGLRVSVATVEILGGGDLPVDDWLARLTTRPAVIVPLGKRGRFDPQTLEADREALRWLLVEEGYVMAEVAEPKIWLTPDRASVRVQFRVEPGERYRVGKVTVQGELSPERGVGEAEVAALARGQSEALLEESQWREAVGREPLELDEPALPGLRKGEVFKGSSAWSAAERVRRMLGDRGYGLARVTPIPQTRPGTDIVDVVLSVERGAQTRVRTIEVKGNVETLDRVIRRELSVLEGDLLRTSELEESRRRLLRTGWYDKVEITPVATDDPEVVDLRVEVFERPTGSLSAGVSFQPRAGPGLNAAYQQDNTLGTGKAVAFKADASLLKQDVSLSVTEPRLNDGPWSLTGWGNLRRERIQESQAGSGVGVTLGRSLGRQESWRVAATLSTNDVRLTALTPTQKRLVGGQLYADGRTNEVSARVSHDTRDDARRPTRGHLLVAQGSLAGGFRVADTAYLNLLGGDHALAEGSAELRAYWRPLPDDPRFVVRSRTRIEAVTSTDGGVVPISRRYRPGGVNSVRGYPDLSLGPSLHLMGDDDPVAGARRVNIGGTTSVISSVEVEARLMPSISAVVFADAGQAWGSPLDDGPTGLSTLRYSVGAGVRMNTPMGLIRLEAGVPLTPLPDSKPVELHFGIGTNF